jgi:hypothetical protein
MEEYPAVAIRPHAKVSSSSSSSSSIWCETDAASACNVRCLQGTTMKLKCPSKLQLHINSMQKASSATSSCFENHSLTVTTSDRK